MDLKAVKVSEHVYWVGAVDWNVRNFHGYTTSQGTTYNAYLIVADKITLVDTVKHGFEEELLARVSSVVDPSKIDYFVSNHAEPDHSGSISFMAEKIKPEKIFASKMGKKTLEAYFDFSTEITSVNDGEIVDFGGVTLKFIETRMLHWPDSMFSYLIEDKILFSQDAFGMHLACAERFDDQFTWPFIAKLASDYYANIITPYSTNVQKIITAFKGMNLDLKMVLPDHGPIWRDMERFGKMVDLYMDWADRKMKKKAVIVFATMWHSTEIMSKTIEDELSHRGLEVITFNSEIAGRSDIASEMIDASVIIVGSPTLNNNLFPSISDSLIYLKGLKFKTPFAAAFGSYGWSGESVPQIAEMLKDSGCDVVGTVGAKYKPTADILKDCRVLAGKVADAVDSYFN